MKEEILTQSHKDTEMKRINQISAEIVDASFYIHQKLGLLINFGAPLIKDGIRRVMNGY